MAFFEVRNLSLDVCEIVRNMPFYINLHSTHFYVLYFYFQKDALEKFYAGEYWSETLVVVWNHDVYT